jgi:hypothetical protein
MIPLINYDELERIETIAKNNDIHGDGIEYDILFEACVLTANVGGISCEIGVREGFGSLMLIMTNNDRKVIGIDPYGDIIYPYDESNKRRLDYTNLMKYKTLKGLYNVVYEYNKDYQLYNMTDTQFFNRFADGILVYNQIEQLLNYYSLVFFDGPHTVDTVTKEIDFFIPRIQQNGMFVFDNITGHYNHQIIEDRLLNNGFILHRTGTVKKSYIKL